jgi:hypothetical protein
MARKTVMRRLSKRLPMSTDLEEQVFERDLTMTHGDTPALTVVDNEPGEPASRPDALEAQIEDAETEPAPEPTEMPAWQPAVDALRNQIDEIATLADWQDADKEFQRIAAGLPDDIAGQLDGELAAARATLGD